MPRQIGMPIPRRVVRMISRPSFSKSKPSIPVKSRKASSMLYISRLGTKEAQMLCMRLLMSP